MAVQISQRGLRVNKLFQIDCMEYMENMPDNHFDLAIVDPPYGIGNFHRETDSGSYKKGTKKLDINYDENYTWNKCVPEEEYFKQLLRISKRQVIWGANYYNCFSHLGGALIWYKSPGLVSQQSQCEIASLSWKKQVDYFHFKKPSGFLAKEKYIHPCQKPIELYKYCLTNYAKPGWLLLDTHSGSGSFRHAAYDLGFDLTSCENDTDYYRDNEAWYQQHIQQIDLFRPEEIQKNIYDGELFDAN